MLYLRVLRFFNLGDLDVSMRLKSCSKAAVLAGMFFSRVSNLA